ncbi:fatty acyl-AMP ligase [Pacificimonas sp. WHA3]|uniref:Fatty acyl-AMP ligase n=1 Tax=Pacificimonas pallii TaxID=2827236 RepID=A0ABS6SAZ0_9SPHN|nr:fatty acyl-AMP ligase [Pacificimonas pallii]MBV7255577.1 fatty acyl-AMP ligase [Pacificimonas pallii]
MGTDQVSEVREPTPTASGIVRRLADFDTLGDALDYAADGACGLNFFDARAANPRVQSYKALQSDARAHALRLIAMGAKPGDRVALIAETGPEFVATFFGCIYAGVLPVPLPLPTSFGGRESYVSQISNQLNSCDPMLAIAPPALTEFVAQATAHMDGVDVLGWDSFEALPAPAADLPRPSPDDIAYLQYSSGSTRFPHGVEVTHRALLANLNGHAVGVGLADEDRVISWLPYYHDMGLVGCLLSPIANQVSADYLATEDFARRPLSWLSLISRHDGTTLSYSPTFGYDICTRRISSQTRAGDRFDLSRWRVAGNGADMIRPSVMEQFARTFAPAGFNPGAFMPSYGLAEATLAVTMSRPGDGIEVDEVDETRLGGQGASADGAEAGAGRTRRLVNCGYALPGMEIEIRDHDDIVLSEGEIGRVLTRGPSIMTGYFRDPEATAACLRDGWLDTGDMGYLKGGAIYIVGRAKDMIIINGKNHWPQDIEWGVEQLPHFKAGDIAAFAITTSDGEERPAVLVQCRTSDLAERARLIATIRDRIKTMTGMSCVVELVPARSLPLTSSGKLSRSKARKMYLSGDIQPLDIAA